MQDSLYVIRSEIGNQCSDLRSGLVCSCRVLVLDSCINMGNDGSRFNVSSVVRGDVTRQCRKPPRLKREESQRDRLKPRSFC